MSGPGRILVFGAGGFIGRHLTSALAGRGHVVTGTSRSGAGELLACDLLDRRAIRDVVESVAPDRVVMAAGDSSVKGAWADPPGCFRAHTETVFNLLGALAPHGDSVHLTVLSSAVVYGNPKAPDDLPFTEASAPNPVSPYGAAKLAAEVLAGQHARENGTRTLVLRLFNQLGPGQGPGSVPGELARRIAAAEAEAARRVPLAIGNPGARRDFTDVRDTAAGIALALDGRLTGTFNLCAGKTTSVGEVARGLAGEARVGVELEVRPERAHPGDVDEVSGDPSRLERACGWRPAIPLERSLADLLDDCRARPRVSPA